MIVIIGQCLTPLTFVVQPFNWYFILGSNFWHSIPSKNGIWSGLGRLWLSLVVRVKPQVIVLNIVVNYLLLRRSNLIVQLQINTKHILLLFNEFKTIISFHNINWRKNNFYGFWWFGWYQFVIIPVIQSK